MSNTFWTIFGNSYFKIKDGKLLQAPINQDNSVDTKNATNKVSTSSEILNQINSNFGSSFIIAA